MEARTVNYARGDLVRCDRCHGRPSLSWPQSYIEIFDVVLNKDMIEDPVQDTGYETLHHHPDFLALVGTDMVPKKKWYLS